MGTRHEASLPRAVKRAVTAAAEYGIARAGIAAVRALDRDVIGQAHHPRGAAGRVTAWEMAHRRPGGSPSCAGGSRLAGAWPSRPSPAAPGPRRTRPAAPP